jgi:hypothetical protein
MALWDGTSLNTNALASMFNQMWGMGAIAIARKDNGLLYAITGKNWTDNVPNKDGKLKMMQKITGNKIELRLMGKLATPNTMANASAELATATLNYDATNYASVQFDLTHYAEVFALPNSEFNRIKGSEAKTKSYVADEFQRILLSYENAWGNMINGSHSDGFSQSKLGNWRHFASDGVSAGETAYKTYGIDRSVAENADFRGWVTPNAGSLGFGKIKLLKNKIRQNGGKTKLLVAETSIYTTLETMVEGYAHVLYDEKWSKFGGSYVAYSNMVGIQDHRAPSGVMGFLDPDTLGFWMDSDGIFDPQATFVRDITRPAARVAPTEAWVGLFCNKPNSNGLMTGITG